ncbi:MULTISPECIES: NADPH-dependent FMN reductase [Streptosporangium]|uniref:Chromate reductase n=1 Tax=Streptosporangium brasiliense TaxID=47480 RepID=A0ABT9REL8_9ACTN|nr:NAD(P)H-dependent oxidoreductase [Streptosporangium brasiliense]MDP9867705.1 chromate reductase [Streptosporangium brasiliense]
MKIVGIAGSVRPGAYVRKLLEASARELPASADFEIWDGLDQVPPFQDGPLPPGVEQLCRTLSGADGVLIAAPAHSALPAQLGEALEWAASRRSGAVLVGKPVAVVTACLYAHEATWTQIELCRALAAAGAIVHGVDLLVSPAVSQFDSEGRLVDPAFRARLCGMLEKLCAPVPVKPVVPFARTTV